MAHTGDRDAVWLLGELVLPEVAATYQRLRAVGGVPKQEAGEFAGSPLVLRRLIETGLARYVQSAPSSPSSSRLQAAPPEQALLGALAYVQARVRRGGELIRDGHQRLLELQESAPDSALPPGHQVRMTTSREEIAELSAHLINEARRDWMSLETGARDLPLTADSGVVSPAETGKMVRRRAIYEQAFVEMPGGPETIRRCAESGEESRILPELPMKMQLADRKAVLLPLTETGTGGVLLIRARPVAAAMRVLFEMLWEDALPFEGRGRTRPSSPAGKQQGLSAEQQKLLGYMMAGLHDEPIAEKMGSSAKTVRRDIKRLEAMAHVTGRFALGVAAHRRGWIS
jgi:DNA-binding CsgD family transcriptional regulator